VCAAGIASSEAVIDFFNGLIAQVPDPRQGMFDHRPDRRPDPAPQLLQHRQLRSALDCLLVPRPLAELFEQLTLYLKRSYTAWSSAFISSSLAGIEATSTIRSCPRATSERFWRNLQSCAARPLLRLRLM
jgi:hypothetical protein